jgi:hypothetical protein
MGFYLHSSSLTPWIPAQSVYTSLLKAHDICPITVQFVHVLLLIAHSICLMPGQSVCILLLNVHYLHQFRLYLITNVHNCQSPVQHV